MAAQGRVGDDATGKHEGSSATGPAQQGAAATFVNGQPALRVGDTGDHQDNSGDWRATRGSSSVFIEGKPAHRQGDETSHDSRGQLAQGSPNVDVGTGNGGSQPSPHDLEIDIEVRDATDRKIKELHIKTECPHPAGGPKDGLVAFDAETKVSGSCSAAPITIYKSLERGNWDAGAKSGSAVPGEVHALDPKNGVLWIHASAPESKIALDVKTAAERQIMIAKASPAKAVVRMTTAYNWMELVYKAFKQTMPTGANQVALVGVREGILGGGQQATRDDDFETRGDRAARGQGDGGHMTKYDDLLFLAVAPKDPAIMQRVEAFECSIDPGDLSPGVVGMPLLLEGKLYKGTQNLDHHGHALTLYSNSQAELAVARIRHVVPTGAKDTTTANHRTFETTGDADLPGMSAANAYKFYREEAGTGILMHGSYALTYALDWSTGCTVLHHSGEGDDPRYDDFGDTVKHAANSTAVTYLIVSSRYVKCYAEWVKEVDKAPDQVPKASSVLRTSGLVTPTNGAKGKYLPTIVSKAFADEVNKKYDDLQKQKAEEAKAGPKDPKAPPPKTPASKAPAPKASAPTVDGLTPAAIQNLKTSLDAVLFEVVDD